MGAWGPAIFSDDTAADIRGEYRELLEDQIPDEEATAQVIQEYQHLDEDEAHVLWLALAAAQAQVGRLEDHVKAAALDVIDTGRGLELWEEAGPKDLPSARRPWPNCANISPASRCRGRHCAGRGGISRTSDLVMFWRIALRAAMSRCFASRT